MPTFPWTLCRFKWYVILKFSYFETKKLMPYTFCKLLCIFLFPQNDKYQSFFFCISWSTTHGGYKWIIMLEKCGYQDLHVFHLKWWAPMTIEKIKTLGVVLELPARQNCQSSPFTSKNGKNGLNWLWCLDGSPQDFDFSNYHGFSTFLLIEIHCSNVSTTSITARQWGAGNVYLLVLSCQKVNIAENPIVVMGL